MGQVDLDKVRDYLRKDQRKRESQNKQAKSIGRHQSTIQKFVSGDRGLGLESFLSVCAHLGKCPVMLTTNEFRDKIARHPLQKRLVKLCDLMFDDRFPFDEPEVFELLALQIEGLWKKYHEQKGKGS